MKFTRLNLLHYSIKVNPSGLCNIKTTEVVELNTCTTIGHSPNSTGIGVLHVHVPKCVLYNDFLIGKSSNDVTSPDTSLDLSISIINIHVSQVYSTTMMNNRTCSQMLRRAPSEPILYANTLLQELGMKQKTKTLESGL